MIRSTSKLPSLLLVLFLGVTLFGCESDESDSDGDSGTPTDDPVNDPPAERSIINPANAGALANSSLLAIDSTNAANAGSADAADSLLAICQTGTSTPTGSISNPLMVGDTFGMDFDMCVTLDMLELDGSVSYTATAVTGTFLDLFTDWSVTFEVTFTDFTATQNGDTQTPDGSYTLDFSYDATTMEFTASTGSETIVFQGGNIEFTDLSYEDDGVNYTVSLAGALTIDGEGETLTLETLVPLMGPIGGTPESGVLQITAPDDSTLTLTFTGGGAVTVAFDETGDGMPECSQDLTFDTLDQFDPVAAGCP